MRPLVAILGAACGLAAPVLLFGATLALLSAIDVEATRLGVGTD